MQHRRRLIPMALLLTGVLAVPGGALAGGTEVVKAEAPTAVQAELKVTRDQAIAAAKAVFVIPPELGEPNVSVNQGRFGAVWSLNWQSPSKTANRISISVEVDGITGAIRGYNRWSADQGETGSLKFSREESRKVAEEWLGKLAGNLKGSLQYVENPLAGRFYGADANQEFRWQRMEQGYPVGEDWVAIAVNARTGELSRYNVSWRTDATYVLPGSQLDRAKAEEAYRQGLTMRLSYQRFQKPGVDEPEWRLVYNPVTGFYPPVGQDGKLLDPSGKPLDPAQFPEPELVAAADQPYHKPAKPLDREQALAVAQRVTGRTDAPSDSNYREYGEEQKVRAWEFSWYKEGELKLGEYNTNMQVNAETGVVTHFNSWGNELPPKEGEQPKLDAAAAKSLAVQWLRTNRPDLAGRSVLSSDSFRYQGKFPAGEIYNYSFQFTALVNGIPVRDQAASVEIDARQGRVRGFWSGEDLGRKPVYPAAEGIIAAGEALEAFLKHQGLQQTWVTFWNAEKPGQPGEPQLVWVPSSRLPLSAIDAKTSAPLDWEGRDLIQASMRPVDISGHFAEKEIELLWSRGIFELQDGKFNPDQPATAGELTRWLVLAKGMRPFPTYDFYGNLGAGGKGAAERLASSADAAYFGAALQAGILLPEDFAAGADPAAPVSRQAFALWAVRAMGYGSIAKMPNRVEMPYADRSSIDSRYANAVGILHGLGVLKGDAATRFNPDQLITRGQAARILFSVASEVRN